MTPPKKVIIAGESLLLTQTLTGLLRKEGLEVLITKNGPQTMRIAEIEHPDIIILDVAIPPLNGIEVLNQLRKEVEFKGPVILMTDLMEEEIRKQGLQAGANTLIRKPVDMDYLAKRVKELLNL